MAELEKEDMRNFLDENLQELYGSKENVDKNIWDLYDGYIGEEGFSTGGEEIVVNDGRISYVVLQDSVRNKDNYSGGDDVTQLMTSDSGVFRKEVRIYHEGEDSVDDGKGFSVYSVSFVADGGYSEAVSMTVEEYVQDEELDVEIGNVKSRLHGVIESSFYVLGDVEQEDEVDKVACQIYDELCDEVMEED